MSLPAETIADAEALLNKIATEVILAQPGSDEGLVPCYSLVSDMIDLCRSDEVLYESCLNVRNVLDLLLDNAQPFDRKSLDYLSQFTSWCQDALEKLKSDHIPEVFPPSDLLSTSEAEDDADEQEATKLYGSEYDVVMDINLEEDTEILEEFRSESVEHLDQIEENLLTLENEPHNLDALAGLFRSYHTIKGVAGFLNLSPIQGLAHEIESLLDLGRKNLIRFDTAMITLILHSKDTLFELVNQVGEALQNGNMPSEVVPVSHLIRDARDAAERGRNEAAGVAHPKEPAATTDSKRAAPTVAAEQPGEDSLRDFKPSQQPIPVPEGLSVVATKADGISEPQPEAPEAPAAPPPAESEPEEVPIPESIEPAQAPSASAHHPSPSPSPSPASGGNGATKPRLESATIRVNTGKLDNLMDMVGELVIVQSQLATSSQDNVLVNSPLQRNLAQLSRITKELQRTSMALRMVPVKPLFQKVGRMVRDLAEAFGKKVTLSVQGEDTELDRTVVEQIGDPLVHMVRNSIDHGIESPEKRAAAGKSPEGHMSLKAYHLGSNIVIEIADDGGGINRERVVAKAQEQGILLPGHTPTPHEINQLIFHPGFSTAEKVTDISGRGVGMDVVRKNIEKLRGSVEVDSEPGRGTTFKIKLPLTMAIIDGLVVRVGDERFILPTTSVKVALKPKREQLSRIKGQLDVMDWRGSSIPLVSLSRRFGIESEINQYSDGIVVLMETVGRSFGLLVDEMLNKQEIVIKSLGSMMRKLPGVSGGAILGDGTIALIIDPVGLVEGF